MNNAQTIIHPECVSIDTKYTFTLNPSDDFQFFKEDPETRITKSINHIKYIIRNNPNYHMDLFLEVSCKGRLHWHGTLLFKHNNHIKNFYLQFIPQILNNHSIEIDTIADPDKWLEYCTKSKHLFNHNIKTSDIVKFKKPNNKLFKPIDEY